MKKQFSQRFFKSCTISIVLLLFTNLLSAQSWEIFNPENSELPGNKVKAIYIDKNGVKWFGTTNGLAYFYKGEWKIYGEEDELGSKQVNDIAFQQSKYGPEIWVATTNGASVFSISVDGVTSATCYRDTNSGIAGNEIYSVAVDTGNVRWFGTNRGISTFLHDTWDNDVPSIPYKLSSTTEDFYENHPVVDIEPATDGWNFMATEGAGVARYRMNVDGITGASIYDEMWTGHPHIKDINTVYVDTSNNQWYGLNKGALQHTSYNAKSDWNFLTEEEGLVNNNVLSITEDSTGSMWFGTAKGVSKFDGENWTSYTKSDGLPGDSIFDITTRFGAIWFATDNGVAKLGEENLPSDIHPGNNPYSNHFRIRIYPNPITANHSTINYYLPKAGKTMISIYDIRGKKVNNLVNGYQAQGEHTINWNVNGHNGQNLAPGIYILEVRNVQHRETKNIVVVH